MICNLNILKYDKTSDKIKAMKSIHLTNRNKNGKHLNQIIMFKSIHITVYHSISSISGHEASSFAHYLIYCLKQQNIISVTPLFQRDWS